MKEASLKAQFIQSWKQKSLLDMEGGRKGKGKREKTHFDVQGGGKQHFLRGSPKGFQLLCSTAFNGFNTKRRLPHKRSISLLFQP